LVYNKSSQYVIWSHTSGVWRS